MRAATVHEIKQELTGQKPAELVKLCQRLAKFKKENKELLTYLLFEAQDEEGYVRSIKEEVDEQFAAINLSHLYFAKKSLRKILRLISKYSRYSDEKTTELELRLHFCHRLKETGIPLQANTVICNLYTSQVKKITLLTGSLHEDLQYDYRRKLAGLGE